jgi:hypothetical protein
MNSNGGSWRLGGDRLRIVVSKARSSLCKQLGVPRRERLRELFFQPPAQVPQGSSLRLVRDGQLVRIGEATDEFEEHKSLIGTQFKLNGLLRLLIHARSIAEVPESRLSPKTAAGREQRYWHLHSFGPLVVWIEE